MPNLKSFKVFNSVFDNFVWVQKPTLFQKECAGESADGECEEAGLRPTRAGENSRCGLRPLL